MTSPRTQRPSSSRPQQPGRGTVGGLRLARVRGVPVVVTPSWLLVALLLTAVYGPVVRGIVPGLDNTTAYLTALGFAALFGVCVLAHEVGHTVVSIALGHPVKRVVLFALGGVSEIDGEPERSRDELLIAAAGPAVSVLIGAAAWGGLHAVATATLPAALLALLTWSNLLLAAFNLLPGLPLDGGRLLRAAVSACGASTLTATRVAAWSGRLLAVAVAVFGLVADRSSIGVAAGLFSVALAAYLWLAASQALRVAEVGAALPDIDVGALLRPGLFVPADVSVAEALRRAWDGRVRGLVVLDAADRPVAIVDETLIGAVPPERRPWTPVSDVARPLEPGLMLPAGLDGPTLLRRMRDTPAHEYLVVHPDGSAAGIIATRDLAGRLRPAHR